MLTESTVKKVSSRRDFSLGVSKDRFRSEMSDCTLLLLLARREDSSAETGSDTVVVTGVDNGRMGEGCDVTPDPRGGLTLDVENRLGDGEGIVEAEDDKREGDDEADGDDDDADNDGGCIERGGCC